MNISFLFGFDFNIIAAPRKRSWDWWLVLCS